MNECAEGQSPDTGADPSRQGYACTDACGFETLDISYWYSPASASMRSALSYISRFELRRSLLHAPRFSGIRERRAVHKFQTVKGKMLHAQTDRLFDRMHPGSIGLPRNAEHQIQTDIANPGSSRLFDACDRLLGCMDSAQSPQHIAVKRLHADTQAVQPRFFCKPAAAVHQPSPDCTPW